MKKRIISAFSIILSLTFLSCDAFAMPIEKSIAYMNTASAKSTTTSDGQNADKLVNEINQHFNGYDYYLILSNSEKLSRVGNHTSIEITDAIATKAVCLTDYMDAGEAFYVKSTASGYELSDIDNGEFYAHFYSENNIKDACRRFFGQNADINTLPASFGSYLACDVVKAPNSSKGALILWDVYEDETDCYCLKSKLKHYGNSYILEKDIYCGYWGLSEKKRSNFKVTYLLAPSANSKFGMAIKAISLLRTSNENYWAY